jgi:hypothetical protein
VKEALSALGYAVWFDDDLLAHDAYAQVIEERLRAAKAVIVIWSAEATKSEWVRSEANHESRPRGSQARSGEHRRHEAADAVRSDPVCKPRRLDR